MTANDALQAVADRLEPWDGLGNPDGAVSAGLSTLEVRWILPGPLPPGVKEWFRRYPTVRESREDSYLLAPRFRGLSLKIRGGERLEVKESRGSRGTLDVPGRARGRLGSWRKWSFPFRSGRAEVAESEQWQRVRKSRRITWIGPSGSMRPSGTHHDIEGALCAVELTAITVGRESWWTLGLEASGPSGTRRGALQAAAGTLFEAPVPTITELQFDRSGSYSHWLRRRMER